MSFHLNLEWKNLTLEVKKNEFSFWKCRTTYEQKTILNNVSGSLQNGQLVAILGESGAGKTTLLAGISYRFRGAMSGQLLLNGTPIDRKTMTKISCFVPQFDITMSSLTPHEHLQLMAELKLDRKWPRARKNQRVDYLLRELGLQAVANHRISTLSGGERKKLNLATDLLTNPPIIFCDEPTTGLDSYNARKVIEALKYLSSTNNANASLSDDQNALSEWNNMNMSDNSQVKDSPKAVICSIHQPTSDIFQCFSQIILMQAGRSIFQGTTEDALIFFSRLGLQCPSSYNPADFFIKVLPQASDKIPIENDSVSALDAQPAVIYESIGNICLKQHENHNSLWVKQVWVLLRRTYIDAKRNAKKFLVAIMFYLIPFISTGLLFSNLRSNSQEDVQDIQGIFFTLTCEIMFSTMYRILNFYLVNTPLLRRETNEGTYSLSAYYVACFLADLPFLSARPLFGLMITYNLAGFSKGLLFFLELWITMIFLAFTANAYGLMLVGIFRSMILEVPTIFNLFFMCISGAYASLRDYPILKYTSLFYYAYEAMSIFYWNDINELECSDRLSEMCLKNGTEVLANISFNTDVGDVVWDFFGLLALGTGMHTLAFIGIRHFIRSAGYY